MHTPRTIPDTEYLLTNAHSHRYTGHRGTNFPVILYAVAPQTGNLYQHQKNAYLFILILKL